MVFAAQTWATVCKKLSPIKWAPFFVWWSCAGHHTLNGSINLRYLAVLYAEDGDESDDSAYVPEVLKVWKKPFSTLVSQVLLKSYEQGSPLAEAAGWRTQSNPESKWPITFYDSQCHISRLLNISLRNVKFKNALSIILNIVSGAPSIGITSPEGEYGACFTFSCELYSTPDSISNPYHKQTCFRNLPAVTTTIARRPISHWRFWSVCPCPLNPYFGINLNLSSAAINICTNNEQIKLPSAKIKHKLW